MFAHQAFGARGFALLDGAQQVFMVGLRPQHERRFQQRGRGGQGKRGRARERRLVVVFQRREQRPVSGGRPENLVEALVDAAPGARVHRGVGIAARGRQQAPAFFHRLR
ncbi:hypothetical protein AD428_20055 [Achromobacter sp. DMS1]|nr:hypothetical protein AD428_20055 [Achromobacter sp. DMS1]